MCVAETFWMEKLNSSGSIGEHLTRAIRTDVGGSKLDLTPCSAWLRFQHSSDHDRRKSCWTTAHLLLLSTLCQGPWVFQISFKFACNFQNIPSSTIAIFHAFNGTFSVLPFLILLFGHLGDQCAFDVMFLFLCLCINPFLPPSPFPHRNVVRMIPLFRCSCAGPGDFGHRSPHVCFYPDA